MNRRRFLTVTSGCLAGAAAGAISASAAEYERVDIGPVKTFAKDGISEDFTQHDFFVIRNKGQIVAVSTTCPHMGNFLYRDPDDSTRIKCRGHESHFNMDGEVVVGPASTGLTRFGITVNAEGRVIVDPNKEFHQDKWGDKGSYVTVK